MAAMQRAPFVISAAVVAGALALAAHLAFTPEPFASDSAVVLAGGALLLSVITAAGLLLSRGRWSLRLGLAVVSGQIGLGLVIEFGPWAFVSIGLNAVALAGLTGPWLRGWLRRRPAAGGPGTRPVLLLVGALALLPGVAISSPDGLSWQHGALGASAIIGAWGYSRAWEWGLWLLRLVPMPLAAAAAAASPAAGGVYLAVHAAAITALAWSGESMRAIRPLLDRVYGPRSARPLDPGARDVS